MLRLFCFALLCFVFCLYAFVEAAALRSIVLRYAGAPIATSVTFFLRCRFFRVFFVLFPLSLCMESTSYVLSFQMVFFYLVTTSWGFDISLCKNSVKKTIHQGQRAYGIYIFCWLGGLSQTEQSVEWFSRQRTHCATSRSLSVQLITSKRDLRRDELPASGGFMGCW